MKKNSIWFLGGLSGGHLYPLFSILKNEYIENRVDGEYHFFIPKNDLIENIISLQKEIFFKTFIFNYSKPQKSLAVLFFLFDSIVIFFKVFFLCLFDRPIKMYSTGGYFSVPFAFCAFIFCIPFDIYHLDVIPGLAGKIIGKFNARQCIIYEETRQYIYNKNIIQKEYPVRYRFEDKKDQYQSKLFLNKSEYYIIFVLGGSQGSQEINDYMVSIISFIALKKIYIIHQTGHNQQNALRVLYKENKVDAFVFDYCNNLKDYYNASDLIIARAGAGALAEINFFKKPALIIPLQGFASNHQLKNAQLYAKKNKLIKIILNNNDFVDNLKKYIFTLN